MALDGMRLLDALMREMTTRHCRAPIIEPMTPRSTRQYRLGRATLLRGCCAAFFELARVRHYIASEGSRLDDSARNISGLLLAGLAYSRADEDEAID